MKTKSDLFYTKESKVLSAVENLQPLLSQKGFKSIQPLGKSNDVVEKENWNSHVFVSSPYKTEQVHHSSYQHQLKVVRQTFTTNKNNEKAEVTFAGRPTMGSKTISAIHHLPASTTLHHHNRMSSQQLKLLSRRINPNEPLSSPHASPKKPPLPNLVRKRPFKDKENVIASAPEPKKKKTHYEFTCEPCNKVYKTRAGYSYHQEKCKYHKLKSASTKAIIDCICIQPTDDSGTMIECIKCNRWLHLKCAEGITKEENYCCPRCIDSNIQQQEESFNFFNLFSEEAKEEQMLMSSPPSVLVNDDFWNCEGTGNTDDFDFQSSNWCNNEDLPSLLFSDNNPPSFIEDFSATDIPSSPINQADWLHFANFDNDFTFEQ